MVFPRVAWSLQYLRDLVLASRWIAIGKAMNQNIFMIIVDSNATSYFIVSDEGGTRNESKRSS